MNPEEIVKEGLRVVESFRNHVRQLLLDGKRSQHEDFQLLFRIFGKEKVVEIAKEELARMNKNG